MRLPGALRRIRGRWKVRRRYRSERALLSGLPVGLADRPSVVLHTVERAASRFVSHALGRLAQDEGLVPIDLDSYHYEVGRIRPWIEGGRGGHAHVFNAPGCFFGPFRTSSDNLLGLPHRAVLVVRDPRDVLVSLHHNYGWESRQPIAADAEVVRAVEREMQDARGIDLDDFVLEMAGPGSHVRQTLDVYCAALIGERHVLSVTYEDMVADFGAWLDRVVRHLGWTPTPALFDEVVGAADFEPRTDASAGRREVVPGGHARKLRPETIDALDRELGHLLRALGYAS